MGIIGIMPILSFSFHLKDCFPKAEVGQGGTVLGEAESFKLVLKFI